MLRVGFELTIPASERAKAFHGLDRVATGIGLLAFNASISETARRFDETYHLHIQGHASKQASKSRQRKSAEANISCLFFLFPKLFVTLLNTYMKVKFYHKKQICLQ
jgi:hypothetical protein